MVARGKTNFSKKEIEKLKCLIAELEMADSKKQKGKRKKLRDLGLYWSEVGNKLPYTVTNFEKLIDSGIITIKDNISEISSSEVSSKINQTILQEFDVRNTENKGRVNSDEYYVIDLCDEVLGEKAERQAKFDFLKGDSGRMLPVDAYYRNKGLIIEYYERQHTESVKFFDKRMTTSGVTRGEQRRIYDERRKTELPKHGIKLVVISYTDFGPFPKLKRDNREVDLQVVRNLLERYISTEKKESDGSH